MKAPLASWLLLSAFGLLFLMPLLVMIWISLRFTTALAPSELFAAPFTPSFVAWRKAWSEVCIGGTCAGLTPWFMSSLLIVVPASVLSVATGAVAGYALCTRTALSRCIFAMLFLGLFIPPQATLYPMLQLLRKTGYFGTTTGLIGVHIVWGLPLVALLFRSFFLALPAEIFRMARLDGATFGALLLNVLLPMSLPVMAGACILQFTYIWNDYLLGLTFGHSSVQPVTVALTALAGSRYGPHEYNVDMAAALITSLPPILLYLLLGQLFARGTAGVTTKS